MVAPNSIPPVSLKPQRAWSPFATRSTHISHSFPFVSTRYKIHAFHFCSILSCAFCHTVCYIMLKSSLYLLLVGGISLCRSSPAQSFLVPGSAGLTNIFFCLMNLDYIYVELSLTWETASCAATQELSRILWNPKVHCRVHKSPTLVSILSEISPVHTTQSYLTELHFNIIPPPTPRSS
jgi:hypothetical protein